MVLQPNGSNSQLDYVQVRLERYPAGNRPGIIPATLLP